MQHELRQKLADFGDVFAQNMIAGVAGCCKD